MSALESIINKGGKVAETDVLTLIELLMNQLLKLDGITADGDAILQRKMQVCFDFYTLHLFHPTYPNKNKKKKGGVLKFSLFVYS